MFSVDFSLDKLKYAIFLFLVYLTCWPKQYVTRFRPNDDNFRQVWSAATAHAPYHVTYL